MSATFVTCAALVLFLLLLRKLTQSNRLPLPPGPPKLPFLGNLLQLPKGFEWETYHRWCKEYGRSYCVHAPNNFVEGFSTDSDIIHLSVVGASIIVLDSVKATSELFEKRGALYSSRPRMPMLGELMGYEYGFAFMPYGKRWKTHRRIMHEGFNEVACKDYEPTQEAAVKFILTKLIDDPDNYMAHFLFGVSYTIMATVYGLDITSDDRGYMVLMNTANDNFNRAALTGTYLVDYLPILKYVPSWFPGAKFKRDAKLWKGDTLAVKDQPFAATKSSMDAGNAKPCFVSKILSTGDPSEDREKESVVCDVAAVIYGAASETTTETLATFMLAMVLHPEIQKCAKDELDNVIEPGNLPGFQNRASLPYIRAIVKECMRWRAPTPLALPHYLRADDTYKGYFLPAGSIVFGNSWAILNDPNVFPEPDEFKPERFIAAPDLDTSVGFGFGRRICPGRHFSEAALFIIVASILYCFDIGKEINADGEEVEPTGEYYSGLVYHPKAFKCTIKPRSQEVAELMRTAVSGGE